MKTCDNPLIDEVNSNAAAMLDFILVENRILRKNIGKRVPLTDDDRRMLVKYGIPVKPWLDQICTIMKPESLLRLNRKLKQKKWDYSNVAQKRPGRPKTDETIESLTVRLAEENRSWGYDRIAGELLKLGYKISDQTVGNILKKHGIPKAPDRKGLTWKQFILSHMSTMWACDFFTEEVWTHLGLKTYYVLFFIHLGTRRIYTVNATQHPHAAWVKQQARNFCMHLDDIPEKCTHLIHDRDTSLLALDAVLKNEIKIVKTPPHSPKCNAYAERFVREARETLDNMILMGERHLLRTMKQIEKHHNQERPHQGIENKIPLPFEYPENSVPLAEIKSRERLGGLLNHYERNKAA